MSKRPRWFWSAIVIVLAAIVAALAAFGVALMVWLADFGEWSIAVAMLLTWGAAHFFTLTAVHRWMETRDELPPIQGS
jgi:hypothetical protein